MLTKINKMMNEKIGIHFDTVSTNEMGAAFTPFFPSTPKEQTILQEQADQIYEIFLDRVAQARHMTLDEVNEIARSEEHTSELQSRGHLVCRLLLEKKKKTKTTRTTAHKS